MAYANTFECYQYFGATVRSRTADILITSEVLYQLSYGGSMTRSKNIGFFSSCVHDFLDIN